ncbi:hypothetical protein [Larkinella terrae]|nr:hypothetical protein [Larkinella terrae]
MNNIPVCIIRDQAERVTVYDPLPVHNKAELAYLLEDRFGIPADMLEVEVHDLGALGYLVFYSCEMRRLRPLELAETAITKGGKKDDNGYWSNSIWLDELTA